MESSEQKIARAGNQKDFVKRAEGLFRFSNIHVAALFIPAIAIIAAIIVNFSAPLSGMSLALEVLLLSQFFVIPTKSTSLHCVTNTSIHKLKI